MKRLGLSLLGLLWFAAPPVQAQFTYTASNGSITITGFSGLFPTSLAIPAIMNGLPVTGIGSNAFKNLLSLTNVTIPASITSIGSYAFYDCGLVRISIPGGVTNFGDYAFEVCANLTNATISNGVTTIGNYAFFTCSRLASVAIPGTVANIGNSAFGYTSLSSVTIPEGVTNIGQDAFYSCANLTNVTVPSNVTNVGYGAFASCTSLTAIAVDAQNAFYSGVNGVLFDKHQTVLVQFPGGIGGSYSIPSSVTNVAMYAFWTCTNLLSVTIPGSISKIGNQAFFDCTSMAGVYFTGNAPTVGSSVFAGDTNGTAYYLAGTTGWSNTFAGLPAVLWNPQIQTGDGSFGVRNNQFGFNIAGTANIPIIVEVCTNLASPVWTPVQSLSLTNGLLYFSDPVQADISGRYYRIRSQ